MLNYNIKFSKYLIVAGLVLYLSIFAVPFGFTQTDWSLPLKKCWTVENETSFNLASDNEQREVILFSNDKIKILNSETGLMNWQISIAGILINEPIVYGKNIFYLAEASDNKIYLNSINIESGLLNWRTHIPLGEKLFVDKDKLFILSNDRKILYRIDITDGKVSSINNFQSVISAVLNLNDKLLIFNSDSSLIMFSSLTNENDKTINNMIGGINNASDFSPKNFIWTNNNNEVGNYDLVFKESIWSRKIGGKITSLRVFENNLLITSLDNFVYFFDASNGELLLKKRLDGRIIKSSNLYQSRVIVSAYNSSLVYIFDIKKAININLVTLSDAEFAEGFVFSDNKLIISTSNKIYAYNPSCK